MIMFDKIFVMACTIQARVCLTCFLISLFSISCILIQERKMSDLKSEIDFLNQEKKMLEQEIDIITHGIDK